MREGSPPLYRAAAAVLDVAFPPRCVACRRGLDGGSRSGFCAACWGDLERFGGPICLRCSSPLADGAAPAEDCAACRGERWAFEQVVALGPYAGLLRRLVLEGKRRGGEDAMRALGGLLGESVRSDGHGEAVVVPIPQHWTRRLARGADGVGAMAEALAAAAGLSRRGALSRCRRTPRQTEVAPSERTANVRGAFAVTRPVVVAGRGVLLIDDVFTTGATCHAAARTLRAAGATRVVAVVAARRVGGL